MAEIPVAYPSSIDVVTGCSISCLGNVNLDGFHPLDPDVLCQTYELLQLQLRGKKVKPRGMQPHNYRVEEITQTPPVGWDHMRLLCIMKPLVACPQRKGYCRGQGRKLSQEVGQVDWMEIHTTTFGKG